MNVWRDEIKIHTYGTGTGGSTGRQKTKESQQEWKVGWVWGMREWTWIMNHRLSPLHRHLPSRQSSIEHKRHILTPLFFLSSPGQQSRRQRCPRWKLVRIVRVRNTTLAVDRLCTNHGTVPAVKWGAGQVWTVLGLCRSHDHSFQSSGHPITNSHQLCLRSRHR